MSWLNLLAARWKRTSRKPSQIPGEPTLSPFTKQAEREFPEMVLQGRCRKENALKKFD